MGDVVDRPMGWSKTEEALEHYRRRWMTTIELSPEAEAVVQKAYADWLAQQ